MFHIFLSLVFMTGNALADNSLMTFMRESDQQKQIMVANSDGTNVRAITTGRFWHLYPAISPNGVEVTYVSGEDGSNLHLVTKPLMQNGATEQWTLDSQKGLILHPSYSGNGDLIGYSAPASGVNQITYFNMRKTRLTAPKSDIMTPEGPRIAYRPEITVVNSPYPSFFPNFSSY